MTSSESDDEERRLAELDSMMDREDADTQPMTIGGTGVRPLTRQEIEEQDRLARKSIAAYWQKDREERQRQTQPGNMVEWFVQRMAQFTTEKPQVKITNKAHMDYIRDYLEASYRMRVEADGHAYISDERTKTMLAMAAKWMLQSPYNGLLIRGYTGVGKSTLMRAISDVFAIVEGKTTMEVSAMEVAKAGRDDPKRFKEMCEADMLAIDDMGTEPPTQKSWGNEVSPMTELITERHRRLRYTVITTNLVETQKGDQIAERYGERLADRLRELCGKIKYGGDQQSYRGK